MLGIVEESIMPVVFLQPHRVLYVRVGGIVFRQFAENLTIQIVDLLQLVTAADNNITNALGVFSGLRIAPNVKKLKEGGFVHRTIFIVPY